MVYHHASLDATFGALADPTRREILTRLATGDRTISELASRFDMSLPAVSKHVGVLQRAGLARVERDGRVRRASLRAEPLRDADAWIERYRRYWEGQLDQLARYLETPSVPPPSSPESSCSAQPPQSQPSRSAGRSARHGSASSTRGRKPKK